MASQHRAKFETIFPSDFIKANSNFSHIYELLDASGYEINSPQDLVTIPDAEWDAHIMNNTVFSNWNDMQIKAFEAYSTITGANTSV